MELKFNFIVMYFQSISALPFSLFACSQCFTKTFYPKNIIHIHEKKIYAYLILEEYDTPYTNIQLPFQISLFKSKQYLVIF